MSNSIPPKDYSNLRTAKEIGAELQQLKNQANSSTKPKSVTVEQIDALQKQADHLGLGQQYVGGLQNLDASFIALHGWAEHQQNSKPLAGSDKQWATLIDKMVETLDKAPDTLTEVNARSLDQLRTDYKGTPGNSVFLNQQAGSKALFDSTSPPTPAQFKTWLQESYKAYNDSNGSTDGRSWEDFRQHLSQTIDGSTALTDATKSAFKDQVSQYHDT